MRRRQALQAIATLPAIALLPSAPNNLPQERANVSLLEYGTFTGYELIDQATKGLKPGDLWVHTAEHGHWMASFPANCLYNMATRYRANLHAWHWSNETARSPALTVTRLLDQIVPDVGAPELSCVSFLKRSVGRHNIYLKASLSHQPKPDVILMDSWRPSYDEYTPEGHRIFTRLLQEAKRVAVEGGLVVAVVLPTMPYHPDREMAQDAFLDTLENTADVLTRTERWDSSTAILSLDKNKYGDSCIDQAIHFDPKTRRFYNFDEQPSV